MRLYEIVVLVLALCLVKYTKAESETDTETLRGEETFARDANLDSTATNDRSSYLKEDPEKVTEEDPKIPTKEDAQEDIRKRPFIRPRPLYLTVNVPTHHNLRFFQVRYCFRRRCYVPGLSQRFLSWRIVYQSGYVVINNWLYYFWNCSPKIRPQPRPTRLRPSPTPTRTPFSRFLG